MKTLHTPIALAAAALVLSATRADAYLDPGSGSYVLQIVLASLLGAAFAVKAFWFRIRNFFASLVTRDSRER